MRNSEKKGTLDLISLIGIVRYKRNNVELPPLLQNDVFQKFVLLFFDR